MTVLDPRVETAVRTLAPRLLGHGVYYSDFIHATTSVTAWHDWLDVWANLAQTQHEIAVEAARRGHTVTAGEADVRAALYLHFGKFLWTEDASRYFEATLEAVALHQRGMARLDPSFRRLEIPFDRDRIVANVRLPAAAGSGQRDPAPLVILVPGLDSTKEEFPVWEQAFLVRGIATVSMDGPGQGEAGSVNSIRHDYEQPVAALLDWLEATAEAGLDLTRVGITGIGVGGYYASRAAAFEPRIGAVGVVGGPYQFARMPPLVRAKFLFSARVQTEAAAEALAAQFTLDGVAAQIRQPYLVIHGGRDAVMEPSEMERHAHAAPRGEFHLYPDGSTACQSVSHLFRPLLADWFAQQLAG